MIANRAYAAVLVLAALVVAGCARDGASSLGEEPSAANRQPSQKRDAKIDEAIQRGVAFLVQSQTADGSWGTGTVTRGWEIYSMVPGSLDAFRVGTTALCVMALREAGERKAHDKGLEYLINHGEARRDDGSLIYNVWAHIYGLQALAEEMKTNKDPRLKKAAELQLNRLIRYETYVGGWNYYDFEVQAQHPAMEATSFGTAAGLVALWEAREVGIDIPQGLIDRAIRRLAECRLPNGAYLYGSGYRYIPDLDANQLRGSVGRTQAGNFALFLWNCPKVKQQQVLDDLKMFHDEHDYIQMGRRRPMPHESWYQTAPYYYYFGHYYAARLVEKIGKSRRNQDVQTILDGILPYQEEDGSWWDFAMWDYHKPYGTAFAVMSLIRCR